MSLRPPVAAPEELLPGLEEMLAEMRDAPRIVQPSAFWEAWNEEHMRLLADAGFARFKQTINRNYFNWMPRSPLDDQFLVVARDGLRRAGSLRSMAARLDDPADMALLPRASHRRTHAIFLALLWEYVNDRDANRLLERLQEPVLGCPIVVRHRGRRISQDLCNSVHELGSMLEHRHRRVETVIELGGGYGRLAWTLLQAFPRTRYVLVDIPPALAVAQRYLTELLPEVRTFAFRRFDDPRAVASDIAAAQLVFLTPNQLAGLPSLDADLFVNISSLHEMRIEQIDFYLREVDRHCSGTFYTKQWKSSTNPFDGVVIERDDYPIPRRWAPIYSRDHAIQTGFFEALYEVRP